MIEVMIPDFKWDENFWKIIKLESFAEAQNRLKYFDGEVPNLLVDVQECGDYVSTLKGIFDSFLWLKRIILKEGQDLIGVFERPEQLFST